MPPKTFTNPKDFYIWDDCKTIFSYGFVNNKTISRVPTSLFVRISEDYRWAKKGTKWMHIVKYSDSGYKVEGYWSTAQVKLNSKVMLEKGAKIVCSDKAAEFKGVYVK